MLLHQRYKGNFWMNCFSVINVKLLCIDLIWVIAVYRGIKGEEQR